MTRSPSMCRRDAEDIIDERRESPSGSAWDSKIHEGSGRTFEDLRYRAWLCRKEGLTVKETAEKLNVSTGFVSKWGRIGAAREYINKRTHRAGEWVRLDIFKSASNRPKKVASPVRDAIRAVVTARRRKYGFEGSDRIKAALNLGVSPSTITKVLREEGLLDAPKRRHTDKAYGSFRRPWSCILYQTDFKTWRQDDREGRSDIKTIWLLEDCTRYILGYRVVDASSADVVIDILDSVTARYGCPEEVLTDHGTEFYSVRGGKGRSKLDRWCKKHGIRHVMGRVRHPQTQGKMERTHRTAKEEVLTFGGMDTLEDARQTFGKWIEYYNWERPHSALDTRTPGVEFLSMASIDIEAFF